MIDLRSDTVTRPSEGMRDVMFTAAVGDDVYGEDPEVRALEQATAKLLGKEAALYVPSGTMANAIAINLHTQPGDSIVTEENSHCKVAEAGGAALLSGVQFNEIKFADHLAPDKIKAAVSAEGLQSATTSLLIVENTHNFAGGLWRRSAELKAAVAAAPGLKYHCDGARIWNAHIATGESLQELAKPFDTLSVCFSKGLGAPVGSALVGSEADIAKAKKIRKRLGGGMRQAGFMARAARFAMEEQLADLAHDHAKARYAAERLMVLAQQNGSLACEFDARSTNMVFFQHPAGQQLVKALAAHDVLLHYLPGPGFRMVFHRDVCQADVEKAMDILAETVNRMEAPN